MPDEGLRVERKRDHLRLALVHEGTGGGFEEVHLVHQSLPELALDQVDLAAHLQGIPMAAPLILGAMTGGAPEAEAVNRDLGWLAAQLGLWVAVGSQRAALADPTLARTYRSVRDANPDGVVLANLGAGATPEEVQTAVEMVGANLIQLHLNAPQELVMAEGERDFRGKLNAIGRVVAASPVPVVVKETGFGLSAEAVAQLYAQGVRAVDVAGRGGTNFARIEQDRQGWAADPDPLLLDWGIPTACALLEVTALRLPDLEVVASGGIRTAGEVAKALALGVQAVAIAGGVWRVLHDRGRAGALAYLQGLLEDLRRILLLTAVRTPRDLLKVPVVLTGFVREWAQARGAMPR